MQSARSLTGQLGKDQFLHLFTTQAKMQNPMNPMKSQDFLAQLAQMSSVEQMSNVSNNMKDMLGVQESLQATDLVGKTVTYQNPDSEQAVEGYVSGVSLADEEPMLMVGNDRVDLDWVSSVREAQIQQQMQSENTSDNTQGGE